jgi:lysophospholipase L1-like esterase
MKRLLLMLLLLPLLIPATVQAQEPFFYLALGNSLARGHEAPGNADGQPGYPDNLYTMIRDMYPAATMTNLGVVGETSTSFLTGQISAAESAIAAQCPDLVTLDIGGNDVGNLLTNQSGADATFAAFESNFASILDRLRSAGASCSPRIVTMSYYNPYPGLEIPPTNENLADQWVPRLNQIITSVASARGVAVAPVAETFAAYAPGELTYVNPAIYTNPLLKIPWLPGFESNVDFHPRPEGHQIIADLMYQASGLLPPVPALDELPQLLPANVSYTLPWTCAAPATCNTDQVTVMHPYPDAPTTAQAWAAHQMHERIARPVVCWSINVSQEILNAYALWLNEHIIPVLNSLYALLYVWLTWAGVALLALAGLLEEIRRIAWMSYGVLLQIESNTRLAAAGGADLGAAWIGGFVGAAKSLQYMVALYMQSVPAMFSVLIDLDNNKPVQVQAIEGFWGLEALRGTIIGIQQSQLGWWLSAQYTLFCLDTGLHITDELKEL